jgi:2-polyprenyl-3-methyl-5-hydroxy-6-metoxy-1,4-benzoquinol methylase
MAAAGWVGARRGGYNNGLSRHGFRSIRRSQRTRALIPPTADHAALTFTGERFTPENRGAIWYEHWHRYCLALPLARGRRVLDAACGEGYGSGLLARVATSVIGIDVGAAAIEHARARYAAPNVNFMPASVTALPLADAAVDLIVSFETIEHLAEQREMLAEFRRVLAHDGHLLISSPNRPVYNEDGVKENEFHVKELDRDELKALLDPLFPAQAWHAQRVAAHSIVWRDGAKAGELRYDVLGDAPGVAAAPAPPMYFMVVCAGAGVTLPALPALSLFDDGALSLWRDYAKVALRARQLAWDELDARHVAEDRLAELVSAVNGYASERQKSAALEARVEEMEPTVAAAQAREAAMRADLERARNELAHTRARLAFRESFAGWARWPLAVARRRLGGARAS